MSLQIKNLPSGSVGTGTLIPFQNSGGTPFKDTAENLLALIGNITAGVRPIWTGGIQTVIDSSSIHSMIDILTAEGSGGPGVSLDKLTGAGEKIMFRLPFSYTSTEGQSFTLTVNGYDGNTDFIFYQREFALTGGSPTDSDVLEIHVTSGSMGILTTEAKWGSNFDPDVQQPSDLGAPSGGPLVISANIVWNSNDSGASTFVLAPWSILYQPAAVEAL
jgi:hypothetical protein